MWCGVVGAWLTRKKSQKIDKIKKKNLYFPRIFCRAPIFCYVSRHPDLPSSLLQPDKMGLTSTSFKCDRIRFSVVWISTGYLYM